MTYPTARTHTTVHNRADHLTSMDTSARSHPVPYDDTETSTSDYAPCTAVTITPLRADGLPDHGRATVHHFDPPITLAYAHRPRLPAIGETAGSPRQDEPVPPLVGFTAALDHPDPDALNRLTREFRQLDALVVVEVVTPREEGPDLRLLITRWLPVAEDVWPETSPEAPSTLVGVGKALSPSAPHPWPGMDGEVKAGSTVVLFLPVDTTTEGAS